MAKHAKNNRSNQMNPNNWRYGAAQRGSSAPRPTPTTRPAPAQKKK